jgi:hypothetical protein
MTLESSRTWDGGAMLLQYLIGTRLSQTQVAAELKHSRPHFHYGLPWNTIDCQRYSGKLRDFRTIQSAGNGTDHSPPNRKKAEAWQSSWPFQDRVDLDGRSNSTSHRATKA